jgi:hypothetical protein
MQETAPISVLATGGKLAYPDDASETPDPLQAIFQYKNFNMLWEHATGIDNGPYNRREGIAFIGNNGTLVVDRQGYEVIIEKEARGYDNAGKGKMESIDAYKKPSDLNYLDLATQNFIEAVKKNDQSKLNTPIKSGSIAAINAQMGNIAYKTGSKVFWNTETNSFVNNIDADKLLTANYQNGWKMPNL